jgi:hypothetical protein
MPATYFVLAYRTLKCWPIGRRILFFFGKLWTAEESLVFAYLTIGKSFKGTVRPFELVVLVKIEDN